MKELPLIQIGNSGVKTTRLCLGCAAAFGRNLIADEKAVEAFKSVYEEEFVSITMVDEVVPSPLFAPNGSQNEREVTITIWIFSSLI